MSGTHTTFRTVTDKELERVLLVFVALNGASVQKAEKDEMTRLVESAGGAVAGTVMQKRARPDAGLFVGSGKASEIAEEAGILQVTTLVFNHDLSPGQVSRLETATSCKVIDRTELILAIFAVQARTLQAKLRIELAQLRYMLPRLSGLWHHLDRLGAGIGTRGPGETQLEVDRRRARERISSLELKIASMETGSRTRRKKREGMFSIALAGYTNAGKSTLLNTLCDADVRSEDRLFATLDTTSRRLQLPDGETVLVSDTVGFIENLPKMLLSSFRSTLDVVTEADLILLVADAADSERVTRVSTVTATLEEIGAGEIPRLLVWNKCDLPESSVSSGVMISALTGEGIENLLSRISEERRKALDWCFLSVDICTGEIENWVRTSSVVHSFSRNDIGGAEIRCGFYLGSDYARKFLSSKRICFTLEESNGWHGAEENRNADQ